MSEDVKKVSVSREFVKCYEYFNVCNVIPDMNLLEKRELYLLLTLCVDKHDDTNAIVLNNFSAFTNEIKEILSIQENEKSENEIILSLIKETGDESIEIDDIVCENKKMRDPFTKEEIRDIKIDLIKK